MKLRENVNKIPSLLRWTKIDSPVGQLLALGELDSSCESGVMVTGLFIANEKHAPMLDAESIEDAQVFKQLENQLQQYFAGNLFEFTVPLRLAGTDFQSRVWEQLLKIPYGSTISYRTLAMKIGQPSASRAVGMANSRNPISILVPCHRVIGSGGKLTGYAGGIAAKERLLVLERQNQEAFPYIVCAC